MACSDPPWKRIISMPVKLELQAQLNTQSLIWAGKGKENTQTHNWEGGSPAMHLRGSLLTCQTRILLNTQQGQCCKFWFWRAVELLMMPPRVGTNAQAGAHRFVWREQGNWTQNVASCEPRLFKYIYIIKVHSFYGWENGLKTRIMIRKISEARGQVE